MTKYEHQIVMEWNETETEIDLHQIVDINGATPTGLITAFVSTYKDILKDIGITIPGEVANGNSTD